MALDSDFLQDFIDEANEHLQEAEPILLELESGKHIDVKSETDKENINVLFRVVHSIKGSAGFFGLSKIVSLSHDMESILDKVRSGSYELNGADVDVLLRAIDYIRDLVDSLPDSGSVDITQISCQLKELMEFIENSNPYDERLSHIRCDEKKIKEGIRFGHKVYCLKVDIEKLDGYDTIDDFLTKAEELVSLGGIYLSTDNSGIMVVTTVMDADMISTFTGLNKICITDITERYLPDKISERPGVDEILKKTEVSTDYPCGDKTQDDIQSDLLESFSFNAIDKMISRFQKNPQPETVTNSEQETVQSENISAAANLPDDIPILLEPVHTANKITVEKKSTDNAVKQQDKTKESIRVDVSLLNELINLTSELVLGRNQLLRHIEAYYDDSPELQLTVQNIDHLTSSLQECVMQTRMRPLSGVFGRLPRIVRDLCKQTNKDIEVVISGGDVELDRSVVEALADPLTHILRNSVDHGIELPSAREKAGKKPTGTISFKAYHEGGFVIIDISDDGTGVNVAKVKEIALSRGLINLEQKNSLQDEDAVNLIFLPGFSTSDKVSDLSGRGVGMDVVRTNIERLGGSVRIINDIGKGMTVRLTMPLTLAIIQSLIVESGGVTFALPQANLQKIIRMRKSDSKQNFIKAGDVLVIQYGDELLPLVDLTSLLGDSEKHGAVDPDYTNEGGSDLCYIEVLRVNKQLFGLITDNIVGGEEILVKSLPAAFAKCEYYSGVTIIGDGKVAMILDIMGIAKTAGLKLAGEEKEVRAAEITDGDERLNLLLFECSGGERIAVDMSMVARVEEINTRDIEYIGDKMYLTKNEQALRVFRPESYLSMTVKEMPEKQYLITAKLSKYPMGMLVTRLLDNIQTTQELNETISGEGMLGSFALNGHVVIVLHPYELYALAAPEWYPKRPRASSDGASILLAEDTHFMRRIISSFLLNAGYNVTETKNGREALDKLAKHQYDAVVSDINMPVMNGFELIKRLRGHEQNNKTPAIALTTMSGQDFQTQCLEAGFDAYEYKLDEDKLLKCLASLINKKE